MYPRLRHIILFVTAGWLLSSCVSDAPGGEDIVQGREVQFAVSSETRTSVTTSSNIQNAPFVVYGDMKFPENTPPIVVFNDTEVRYKDNRWTYGATQYWFPKHEHSFVALHPAGAVTSSYSNSTLSLTYTLPDNFRDTHDLMVATHRRKVPEDNPSYSAAPVRFGFFHLLSRVNFQVKNDGAADRVRVTEIKLEGVDKTGTFTITPAPLSSGSEQTDDYVSFWDGISDNGSITANIRVDIPEDEERPLFPDDNALFVIPQPQNKGVIMRITYTLIDAGADDEELTLTAETPIGGWEYGKVYTYSLFIEEITKEIELTVSVKNWQAPKPTGVTVPES